MEKQIAKKVLLSKTGLAARAKRSILFSLAVIGLTFTQAWANDASNGDKVVDNALAAQQTISGTVTDSSGAPIPGANVIVVGTTNGTQTDFDGNYTIDAAEGDQLQFSYLGFGTKTVTVGSSSTVDVTMEEESSALEEVVVIGYGARKKKDITGAIATLMPSEITKQIAPNPELAIQGKLPGVLVGNPGPILRQDRKLEFVV